MTTVVGSEFSRLDREHGWRVAERAHLVDGVWMSGDRTTSSFEAHGHELLRKVEERSLWFSARNALIEQLLKLSGGGQCVWDVGAGNGFVALALQQAGIPVVALEPGEAGARAAAERGVGEVVCGTLEGLDLPSAALGAIGLFDVIEHLEDPVPLLMEVRRILRPDGRLVVTVPAFGWLWSEADVIAGHQRRYRRRELEEQLVACGFTVLRSTYHFAAALPAVLAVRVLGRRRRDPSTDPWETLERDLAGQSAFVLHVGRAVMRAERAWSRRFLVPFGTSVFAVCR